MLQSSQGIIWPSKLFLDGGQRGLTVLSSVPAPTNGSREAAACKAQKARESPTWRLERLRGSPLSVSWVHCLAPGVVMSIVWERGNDPRQMENNNVSPLSCLVPLLPPEDTMTLSKVPNEGLWPGYIWEAILLHLDCCPLPWLLPWLYDHELSESEFFDSIDPAILLAWNICLILQYLQ